VQILAACFRRAIYCRMHAQIDPEAMYRSIGEAIGAVQPLRPHVHDQAFQLSCDQIITALDDIERTKKIDHGMTASLEVNDQIDDNKRKVVQLLLEIRRVADIKMQLPFSLREDAFFGLVRANGPPTV
jgi:hypothetical protein